MHVLRLHVPLDLALTLGPYHRGHGDPTMRLEPGRVVRAWRTNEGGVTLEARQVDGNGDPAHGPVDRGSCTRLAVEAWGPGADIVMATIEAILGIDDSSADTFDPPELRPLRMRVRGLRLARSGAVLDALVPAIVGQRVTVAGARASLRRLTLRHGEPAPGPWGLRLPPDAAGLLRLTTWEWHLLGIEDRRASTIRYAADRAERLEALAGLPPTEARERLCTMPGIGPWTAAMTSSIAFGDPDAVPVGDLHVPAMVAWNLAREPRADDARLLELLEPYRGQRGRVVRWLKAAGAAAPRRGPRRPLPPPIWE